MSALNNFALPPSDRFTWKQRWSSSLLTSRKRWNFFLNVWKSRAELLFISVWAFWQHAAADKTPVNNNKASISEQHAEVKHRKQTCLMLPRKRPRRRFGACAGIQRRYHGNGQTYQRRNGCKEKDTILNTYDRFITDVVSNWDLFLVKKNIIFKYL